MDATGPLSIGGLLGVPQHNRSSQQQKMVGSGGMGGGGGIPRTRSIMVERSNQGGSAGGQTIESPALTINGKKPKQLEPMSAAPGSSSIPEIHIL